jgi:adenylosuccinate lyase
MELNALTALAPVDGRYRATAALLAPYLSEWGLIRHRVEVEVEYLIALSEVGLPELPVFDRPNDLRALYRNFSLDDAQAIKATERTTNHDVKAVEYWLKEQLNAIGAGAATEFVHFGLTSQDVNNTALPLSLQRALQEVVLPMLHRVRELLADRARQWKGVPMLARTHGQPASPTTLARSRPASSPTWSSPRLRTMRSPIMCAQAGGCCSCRLALEEAERHSAVALTASEKDLKRSS